MSKSDGERIGAIPRSAAGIFGSRWLPLKPSLPKISPIITPVRPVTQRRGGGQNVGGRLGAEGVELARFRHPGLHS